MRRSQEDLLYIGAEDFFERSHDLAFGGECFDSLDHGWHQVDFGICGLGLELREYAGYGVVVAALFHVVESLELVLLDFGADTEQVAFARVTFGELVDAHNDAFALG